MIMEPMVMQYDGTAAHGNWEPDLSAVPRHLRSILLECVKNRTILRLPTGSSFGDLDKTPAAFHFSRLCIEEVTPGFGKACILAPTAPLIKRHFTAVNAKHGLRVQHVMATRA